MSKLVIFYHGGDYDGVCGAAIMKKVFQSQFSEESFLYSFIPCNYKQGEDLVSLIGPGDKAVMIDYHSSRDQMLELKEKCSNFIWIDHHISAINEFKDIEFEGLRNTLFSGCELTWLYFFKSLPMPIIVRLLGRYDVWDFTDKQVEPFQMYMRQFGLLDPDDKRWWQLFDRVKVDDYVEQGKAIKAYQDNQNRRLVETSAFESLIKTPDENSYRAVCINASGINSKCFEFVYDEAKHDVMVRFSRTKDESWSVSLYTTKDNVDCSVIAKYFGGRGHKKAAGLTCKYLPLSWW